MDTSALIAVIVGEPERDRIIQLTGGHSLLGPGSIPWEVGNAFSAMLKQERTSLEEVQRGLDAFESVPVRYLPVDLPHALSLANRANLYAYDAYVLDCALRHRAPLLTLDRALRSAAEQLRVRVLEV
ncbi:MAG: type II toxin-antitoxin system VapC family toxin [Planctomycetota bacterium]